MKPAAISTYFVPYTAAEFKVKVEHIIKCLENNPHFIDPVPTLEGIRILAVAYSEALKNSSNMDRLAIAVKNETRKKLEHELARLALYIMYIADGDVVILTSTGYDLTKTPEKVSVTKPGNIKLRNGISSGLLTCSLKAVKGAKLYFYEVTQGELSEKSQWQNHPYSKCSYTFTNLQPGTLYFFRVMVVGTDGQKIYSDVIQRWAQ